MIELVFRAPAIKIRVHKLEPAVELHEFVEHIVFAGFGGLLIDRYGYKDSEVEQSVLSYLGPTSKLIWEGGGYILTCELSERNWEAHSLAKNAPARKSLNLPHENN
jgi:hypothetical protein